MVESNGTREEKPTHEGLSMIDGEGAAYLRDIIEADPEDYLGEEHVDRFGKSMGVLVKFLDSAERLPHPCTRQGKAKSLFSPAMARTEPGISWTGGKSMERIPIF